MHPRMCRTRFPSRTGVGAESEPLLRNRRAGDQNRSGSGAKGPRALRRERNLMRGFSRQKWIWPGCAQDSAKTPPSRRAFGPSSSSTALWAKIFNVNGLGVGIDGVASGSLRARDMARGLRQAVMTTPDPARAAVRSVIARSGVPERPSRQRRLSPRESGTACRPSSPRHTSAA